MTSLNPSLTRRQALAGALGLGAGAVIVTLTGCGPVPHTTETVKVSDVPVGGGAIVGKFVVTQPTAGQFKAFSSVCPHAGAKLGHVSGGEIVCEHHGARFKDADGSCTSWPKGGAGKPLTPASVSVDGDTLTLKAA